MARDAEFEEKEYEGPLYQELCQGDYPLWPPGQVFEEYLGFDAALWTDHRYFWQLLGFPEHPRGAVLGHFNWGYLWRRMGKQRALPPFAVNLLIQAKRPAHRNGKRSDYAANGIKGAYWQFRVTPHQHEALSRVREKLAHRVLICYASPAFDTHEQLFGCIERKGLVLNSTFVRAHRLDSHKQWVYDRPGTEGLACSNVKPISDVPFEKMLAEARQRGVDGGEGEPLLELESGVRSVVEGLPNNPIARELGRRLVLIDAVLGGDLSYIQYRSRAFAAVTEFCQVTNTDWLVVD